MINLTDQHSALPVEIAFVFSDVANHAELAAAFRPGVEVHVLDAAQDGLAGMASILAGRNGIAALHVVGHGAQGALELGSVTLDAGNIGAHGDALRAIGAALAEDGDIRLYGCEVAGGAAGTLFVARLAQATGADIAASTDNTGSAALGGNWTLEYTQGAVGADAAFDTAAVAQLNGLLAIPAAGVKDVTSGMGIGNFVPGFTLDISAGDRYVSSPEAGYDPLGIYIFSEADQSTANIEGTIIVEADHVNLGSFDLTGLNVFKYNEGDINGAYNFTLTGYKPDGSTVVTTFYNPSGSTAFSVAPNFSAFTGIVKYTLQINSATLRMEYDPPQTIYPVSNWTFDSFTIANTHGPNVVTAFLGASTLSAVQGGAGVSVAALLHVSDTDDYQTLTWSQQTAPGHGTLSFSGATAAGGSSNITPGGSITYTPAAGYVGADSFTVRVYDGFQAVTKTISVNVAPARPSAPDLAGATDTGASSTDNITNNLALTFTGTGAAGDSSSSVRVFVDANNNGSYDAGTDATGTATLSSGAWTVSSIATGSLADGSYNVYAYTTSSAATGSLVSALSDPLSVTLDRTAPTLAISSNRTALKAGETATVTFTFSEDPGASFVLGDIAVSGGALGALAGSGTTRTAVFTPTPNSAGTASITVAAGNYSDPAGNNGGAGTTPSLTFDTLAPTLAITSDKSALKGGETATITFTFSEDPGATFAWDGSSGDIVVTGGTLSAISGSGLTRTATFTPTTGANGAASITVSGGAYTDAAGNGGGAGATPGISFDTLAPTVAISSSDNSLKAGDTATITFTFSEDPGASFDAGDIVVSGGTLGALSGTGMIRSATFTPAAGSSGTATVSIGAGTYLDPAGNGGNAGASAGIAYDTQAPGAPSTPALDAASDLGFSSSDAVTSDRTPTLTGTAEDGATVTLYGSDGSTVIGTGVAAGGNWSITTSELAAGSHSITARATDVAGNPGSMSAALALSIDATAPTVAITSDASVMRVGGSATITFTFSEDPGSTFAWDGASGDIVVSGGTLSALSGSGAVRTALFTPTDGSSGTASITIASGAYTDAAGNAGGAGATPLLEIDTSVPTLAITSDRTTLKAGEVATITFTFSEDPGASFTDDDITVSGGTLGPLSGTGSTRTATFTPAADTDNGSAGISVASGLFADLAGNPGGPSAGPDIAFDTLLPAASSAPDLAEASDLGLSGTDNLTSATTPTFTGTAEDGATVTLYDGATVLGSAVATGGAWSITSSALAGGSHTITTTVTDAAGNVSGASAGLSITVDTSAPTLAISADAAALKAGESATVTFTFSEDPGDTFTLDDVSVSGGTLGALAGTGTTRTASFTPAADSEGTASITVAGGAYADAAGNTGGAGATPVLVFDTLAPALSITSDTAVLRAGQVATITFTFSEDPDTSFTAGDVVVSGGTLGALSGSGLTRTASFTPAADTNAGVASITVAAGTYMDAAGNGGSAGSTPVLTFDTLAPAAPSTPDLAAAADSGVSDSDNVTADATPTFSGTAEEGATVTLYDGATGIGSAVATGGSWSIASGALADGSHSITAVVTDAAGNNSSASAALAVTVDSAPPTLAITSDVAALKIGEAATITFTFDEDPGATFAAEDIVVSGGTLGALAGSGLTRTATFTPTASTNGGTASITVAAGSYVDAAGNAGAGGATPSLVFDTLAPTLAITSNVAALKAGQSATITFTFSEDPGASSFSASDITVDGGTLGAIDGTGAVRTATFTPDPDTNGGTASITVGGGSWTDNAGNAGGAGAAPLLVFDTLAPAASSAPDLEAAGDSGSSDTDNLTSDTTPTLTGAAEEGATVTLYDGATEVGSAVVSGGVWSITASALADGTHTLATVVTDAAGNASPASPELDLTIDTAPPTLAITSDAAALKAGELATITFTFSENPGASFDAGDIVVSGGTLGALAGSGATRTAIFTPAADSNSGTASITVAAGQYADAAGNTGGAGATPSLVFDTLAPTLDISSNVAALKAGELAVITFTFSEDPGASFVLGDVAVTGGALGPLTGTGLTRSATFTPAADTNGGTATVTVAAGAYADAAGNAGAGHSGPALTFDTLVPAASSTPDLATGDDSGASDADNLTSETRPAFSGSAEDGATVTLYDGATAVGTGVASGGAWTITPASPLADGAHLLSAVVTDAAGNVSAASAALALSVDTGAPALAITSDVAVLKAGETATITFSFGEDPGASFTSADIAVSGGTLGTLSGTGLIRTATFTPAADTASGTAGISVGAGSYADAAGNTGGAGASPSLVFDTLAPSLAITSDAAALKAGETATITFTFSEDPGATFSAGDIVVAGGTLGALAGSGAIRTATFTPAAATNGGSASITVSGGTYTDAAGNGGNAGTSPTLVFDTLAPAASAAPDLAAATDSGVSDSDNITSASTPVFAGAAEAGATVRLYDGAVLVGSAVAAGGAWTITSAALAHGSHALTTTVTDAAGNVSAASAALALTVDTQAPTLAITSDVPALKAGDTALVTFTFSEDPGASFGAADITVAGGSLGALSGTGNIRTAVFTPAAGASGSATISVDAGLYADVAGNTGSAATAPGLVFDTLAPTLAISSDAAALKAGQSATITFTFSEDPGASFTLADITVGGGTLGALSGAGLTRTATFTPAPDTNGGSASITVAAGTYADAAGNTGGAGAAPSFTFDTLAPTLSITSDVAALKEGETAEITFTFSEDPGASFERGDVTVSGGTLGALSGAGNTRTATFTPAAGATGAASVTVAAGAYADAAGNAGGSGATPVLSFDTQAPSLAITSSAAALGAGQSATITFTFSEDPGASFALDDVTVGGGTLGPLAGSGSVRTATFTPAAGSTAPASFSVAAGSYTDSAGNAGTAAAATLVIDTIAPAVPSAPRLSATSDTGSSDADGVTAAENLVFTGTAEDGATVKLVNAGTGALLGSGVATGGAWSITLSGLAEGSTSIAAVATDAVGNASAASAATTVKVDRVAPGAPSLALVLDSGVAGDGLTRDGTVRVQGLASGASWEYSTDGGIFWSAGSGSRLVLEGDGEHSVIARQTDNAGNTGPASAPLQVRLDTSGPTSAVTLSDSALSAGETATVTVSFNEAVSGLDASDLTLSNASVGAFTSSDGGRTWTASLTPAAGISAATNTIQVSNAGVTDLAGNAGSGASVSGNYSVMTMGLGAAITLSDAELKAGERAQVTMVFSEAVTGFTLADLVAENGVLSNLASTDGGRTWTATLTPAASVTDSSNTITLDNTGVTTVNGVAGQGVSSSGNYTVSTVRPTAVVTVDDQIMAPGDTAQVTVQFSEAVSGFDSADLSVTGGALSALTAVDGGRTWTATLTASAINNGKPSALGYIKLDMAGVQNGAGNAGFGNVLSTTFAVLPANTTTTTVDGAMAFTGQVTDPDTGLPGTVIIVPATGSEREDDPGTPHTALADIPVGLPAGGGAGNSLVVGLPAGAGLQAHGANTPLSNVQALSDLVARIADSTGSGSPTQQEMTGAGGSFLDSLGAGATIETRTIQLYLAPGAPPARPIVVAGQPAAPGSTAPALALVLDGSALPAGTAIQLDNVDFAAVVGDLRLLGGAGSNYVVGDAGSQVIYLGEDDDTLAGGAGNDFIGSAGGDDHLDGGADDDLVAGGIGNDTVAGGAGNDIITGGRSTTGSWDFFVSASGAVTARHNGAVFTLGGSETVQGAELDGAQPELSFLGADAQHLVGVTLLYSALGRAPDLEGLSFWSREGVSLSDVAAGVMGSAEWGSTPLGQAGDEAFVRGMYLDLLGREVDAAGLGFWTAALAASGPGAATRADVLAAVALSSEHRSGVLTADGYKVGHAVLAQERGWFGGSGDDRLVGGSGNDQLVGGDGHDTAVFAGNRGDYRILVGADDVVRVAHTASGDVDTVAGIELAEFADGSIDLSFLDAGRDRLDAVGLLYQAVFDRAGDAAGLAWWLGLGASTGELAQYFTATAEFAARYGSMDDAAFVQALYANSGLDLAAEGGALAWVDFLGSHTRAELVAQWIAQDGVIAAQFGTGGLWLL